jgi:hypothetical protein
VFDKDPKALIAKLKKMIDADKNMLRSYESAVEPNAIDAPIKNRERIM